MYSPSSSNNRLLFLDLLRGIATLWMIPTHVLGILLNAHAQENPFYQLFLPTTGYVAVAFIFCAGSASWYSLERKGDSYRALSPELWKHLRRTFFILLTAYWFNISTSSWAQLKNSPIAIQKWLAFDVLQVIGFSILISLLIVQFIRSAKYLKWFFLLLGLLIYAVAPLVWNLDYSQAPLLIKSIFSRPPDTAFPFFPWVGHFFMGAAITGFFAHASHKKILIIILLLGSMITPSLVFYINGLDFQYPGWQNDWWFCNPGNSFLRLSKVTFMFSLLFLLEPLVAKFKAGISFLTLFSKESLQIYVFHIILVYGRPFLKGLSAYEAQQLDMKQALFVTLGLTVFSFLTAWTWHLLKERKPLVATWILATYSLLFAVHFFIL